MASTPTKRQRVVDDKTYVHCTVKGPKGDTGIGPLYESEGAWPYYTISFRRTLCPTFFDLWSKLTSVMLYANDEKVPFTDMDCLLSNLEDVEFTMGEWTDEYSELHDKLLNMCDEKALANIDADIARLSRQIQLKEERRAAISAKITGRKRVATRRQNSLAVGYK